MTETNLDALACEDCPATVSAAKGRGMFGDVLIVAVIHEPTCPWLARVAPESATVANEHGILIHAAQENGSVGDDC